MAKKEKETQLYNYYAFKIIIIPLSYSNYNGLCYVWYICVILESSVIYLFIFFIVVANIFIG